MLGEYTIKTPKFDKSYEFNLTRTYSTYRLKIDPFHFKREDGNILMYLIKLLKVINLQKIINCIVIKKNC
jgi:hypothetical protein